jgi:hypothetical protein
MAVTITRTPWVDDDGTGTTGTIINNAVKTELYNQIDAALGQLLPASGGPVNATLVTATTGFKTASNALTIATGVPTALCTLPAGEAVFLIFASAASDAVNYGCYGIAVTNGGTARMVVSNPPSYAVLSLAGMTVNFLQSSGATQTVWWNYIRTAM